MDLEKVEYRIVDRHELDAEARLNGLRIGYANCIRRADRLQLADIRIEEQFRFGRPTIVRRLLSLIGMRRPVRLRCRGIGTELLRTVLRAADSTGIREIWGSVTADDL